MCRPVVDRPSGQQSASPPSPAAIRPGDADAGPLGEGGVGPRSGATQISMGPSGLAAWGSMPSGHSWCCPKRDKGDAAYRDELSPVRPTSEEAAPLLDAPRTEPKAPLDNGTGEPVLMTAHGGNRNVSAYPPAPTIPPRRSGRAPCWVSVLRCLAVVPGSVVPPTHGSLWRPRAAVLSRESENGVTPTVQAGASGSRFTASPRREIITAPATTGSHVKNRPASGISTTKLDSTKLKNQPRDRCGTLNS